MGQSRLDESITAFETAITDLTYRRPAVPLSNMGMALYLSGDHQRAVKTLDRAIDRAPNLCQAFFHRGLANKALKSEAAPAHSSTCTVSASTPLAASVQHTRTACHSGGSSSRIMRCTSRTCPA